MGKIAPSLYLIIDLVTFTIIPYPKNYSLST